MMRIASSLLTLLTTLAKAAGAIAASRAASPGNNEAVFTVGVADRLALELAGVNVAPEREFNSIFDEAERRARDPLADRCVFNH